MLAIEARARLGALELDVELRVAAGECLALAGPSGAGKTSVLRVAAGLLRPDRGRVTCGERTWLDTSAGGELPPERRRCGYVFQDYALFPYLRAWENVAYGLNLDHGSRGHRRSERRSQALAALERFGVAGRADAYPRALSGGERQRVALARALAPRPQALLLDEPLAALDATTRASASRELATVLREAGAPAILVTHDFAEAALLGDRVGILDAGRLVQQGTASELAARPESAFVADLTGAVVLTGTAGAGPDGLTRVELDGGGSVASVDPAEGPVAASVHPWEIALEPREGARVAPEAHAVPKAAAARGRDSLSSAQNRLSVEVISISQIGSRVRVGLAAPQPLTAEVTAAAVRELGLAPGTHAIAAWKATATRLIDR